MGQRVVRQAELCGADDHIWLMRDRMRSGPHNEVTETWQCGKCPAWKRVREEWMTPPVEGAPETLKETVIDLVMQFGYRQVVNGQLGIGTGGLSALEVAFKELGWDDPHVLEDPVWCDGIAAGSLAKCPEAVIAGVQTVDGWKRFCTIHYRDWRDTQR